MKNHFIALLILFSFIACKDASKQQKKEVNTRGTIAEKAMVVSARKEASEIGVKILKLGGNAFDAMMATEMALAVTYPYAGNLGGGGFLVFRLADGTKGALDFREKAPIASTKNMYLDENGNVIKNLSTVGSIAIGVPGTIAGIFEAQKKYGKLDVITVLKPVIELANNGFVVTKKQAKRFAAYDSIFSAVNKKQILFNKSIKAGDTLRNKALAQTLQRISDHGRNEFYTGKTAETLVSFLQSEGSIISLEDLKKYETKWRNPVTFEYDDLTITSMSPPSSCSHFSSYSIFRNR